MEEAPAAPPSVLDALLDASPPPSPAPPGPLLGECLETRGGEALVRVAGAEARWAPVLRGAPVHAGDRVLLVQPPGAAPPVVVGALGGSADRAPPPAAVALRADQALEVRDAQGAPLLEVAEAATGVVIRLLRADLDLELPGALRVSARSIELSARQGGVAIDAAGDVTVDGRMIRLN